MGELETITRCVEDLMVSWDLPMSLEMTLNLVLEEAFTNVVLYAYADEEEHEIRIEFRRTDQALQLIITDDGKPYDPTARQDPDITLPAEERGIGGLGIFLIRKMMDKVVYVRDNGYNILTMEKAIPGKAMETETRPEQ